MQFARASLIFYKSTDQLIIFYERRYFSQNIVCGYTSETLFVFVLIVV